MTPPIRMADRPALITGGAGFIGTNLAARLVTEGRRVTIFDSLARAGVEANVRWLRDTFGDRVALVTADVRDRDQLAAAVRQASAVYHFAAQVAVTTSLTDPLHDFYVNAGGTLNLLEELRALDRPPPLLFTSTNKVYGDLEDVNLVPQGSRYVPADVEIRRRGISEQRPIDFHSPYGCSKGAADQYVIDYARTFGLPAVVFRMSCIYGPHQCGNEDQGWVAHFVMRASSGCPITVYGDGLQVRDVLFVEDLVDAMLLAQRRMGTLAGQAFNIGGGPERSTSLVELLDALATLTGRGPLVRYEDWREADQRYYVSDTSKFRRLTGWVPQTGVVDGLRALHGWLTATHETPTTVAS